MTPLLPAAGRKQSKEGVEKGLPPILPAAGRKQSKEGVDKIVTPSSEGELKGVTLRNCLQRFQTAGCF